MSDLQKNIQEVYEQIKNGNNLGEKITLVGASKMQTVQTINSAIDLGITDVGENKAQEFRDKYPLLNKNCKKHFIGRLQSNKIKYLVGKVDLIHSVDSVQLAKDISDYSLKLNCVTNILLEINVSLEESKGGFYEENLEQALKQIANFKGVKILGFMTIFPNVEDEIYIANLCKKARELYDFYKQTYPDFCYLSMGMTNDYKIAIKNGSNMIRVGTAIFGQRNYN